MSHPAILYWERQRRERHRPRQPLRHADSAPMLPAIHAAHDLRFPSLPPAVHRREATRLGEKLREATQARMASQQCRTSQAPLQGRLRRICPRGSPRRPGGRFRPWPGMRLRSACRGSHGYRRYPATSP
ncbi:unnamed protein product [Effrenium voratum]|uniref:Uncharacterized protein n=1 Tax=Effrenium voratum TaxID=2562239 RepID=A0AA36IHQ7_9DINO|nr:unnamed protein product [Effrenium voratum]